MVVTNRRSAEMIKYASNDFLALKISIINEIVNVCEIVRTDIAFIPTEWNEIKSLDLSAYEELMNTPAIFDGRNCYKIPEVEKHKMEYYSVGRKEVVNLKNINIEVAATIREANA